LITPLMAPVGLPLLFVSGGNAWNARNKYDDPSTKITFWDAVIGLFFYTDMALQWPYYIFAGKLIMKPLLLIAALCASLISIPSFAADPADASIIIRHSDDKTYYEYTVNGEVVEIKVVPKKGPSYYLVPAGGDDSEFKKQTESDLVVPKWVIFRW